MNSPNNTPLNSFDSTPKNTPYMTPNLSSSNVSEHKNRPSYHRRYKISRSNLQKLTDQRSSHLQLYRPQTADVISPRYQQTMKLPRLPNLIQSKFEPQNSNNSQYQSHQRHDEKLVLLNETIFQLDQFQVTMKILKYQSKQPQHSLTTENFHQAKYFHSSRKEEKLIQFYMKKVAKNIKKKQVKKEEHIQSHFHADYTFSMLSSQIRFVFGNIQNLYEYIAANVDITEQKGQLQNIKKLTHQNQKQKNHAKIIQICQNGQILINIFIQLYPNNNNIATQQQKSQKTFHRQLFIQTFQLLIEQINPKKQHHTENAFINEQQNKRLEQSQRQQKLQKEQYERRIRQLEKQLIQSHKYTQELKKSENIMEDTITSYKEEYEKNNEQKLELQQELEKVTKSIKSIKNQEHLFDFVPDKKLHNYQNFKVKQKSHKDSQGANQQHQSQNICIQVLKIHHDLKWDQICSQNPIPQTQKHYFSFTMKSDILDYMFGIITLKGKGTLNAFLTTEAICLYVSKNSLNIYETGKHFKISHESENQKSTNINGKKVYKNDTIFVQVDMDKGQISWSKGRVLQQKQEIQHNYLGSGVQQNTTRSHIRKSSQSFSNSRVSISVSLPTQKQLIAEKMYRQRQFLYSCKIPSQMLQHKIFGYFQVYNNNDKILINVKEANTNLNEGQVTKN